MQHALGLKFSDKSTLSSFKHTRPLQEHYVRGVIEPLVLGVGVLDDLHQHVLTYSTSPPSTTEQESPDLTDALGVLGGGYKMNLKGPKRSDESTAEDLTMTDFGGDIDSARECAEPADSGTLLTVRSAP